MDTNKGPHQCCLCWLWSIETLLSWALCPATPHNCTWPIKNIHINEDTFRSLGFEMTSNGFSNNHKCKIEISIRTSLKTIASKYFLTCDLAWSIRATVQLQTTLVTRSCAVFRWSDGGHCGQVKSVFNEMSNKSKTADPGSRHVRVTASCQPGVWRDCLNLRFRTSDLCKHMCREQSVFISSSNSFLFIMSGVFGSSMSE